MENGAFCLHHFREQVSCLLRPSVERAWSELNIEGIRYMDRINPNGELHKNQSLKTDNSLQKFQKLQELKKKHGQKDVFSQLENLVVSLLTVDGKIEEKLVEERSVFAMEEIQVAAIGSFCWNEACEDYQQV